MPAVLAAVTIGGEAYEALRLVRLQNLGPGGTLWNVPPQNVLPSNAVSPLIRPKLQY